MAGGSVFRSERVALTLAACLALAACTSSVPLGIGGTSGAGGATVANTTPDERGVIAYATYQVAVAREGDTIASVAARVGTTPAELSARNGLPTDYRLRAGEVVVLPDSVPRAQAGWSTERAAAAIDGAGATAPDTPFQTGPSAPLIDPIRHRVEPGETAYSIARLYGVSVTALASWNGLGPDLGVRVNQELLIPIVSGANQITTSLDTQPGQGTPVTPPPSAAQPLPDNIVAGANPASPELGQFRTPPGGRLQAPVNGPVTKSYNLAPGPNRSEGIGFSVPAGTTVRAAGDGEVALVSDSLGGLGTIVLVRHGDDLMTVYGRVSGVTVERGQRVSAGQSIGVVAENERPELHFEVRRGTQSVDPGPYLGL
jgi:lipoprotein NlpD